ncbi:MAG: Rossmann-like and DUF2520 domain-containing protein [Syntrophales bacterium]
MKKDVVCILGMGRVGSAVGCLLRKSGYEIAAVASRSKSSAERGAFYTGARAFTRFSDAASLADCILITTSDDAIASVCNSISAEGGVRPGKKVIHMSGAGGLDLLESARKAGAYVASIHPIQSFADIKGGIENIPGSTFGITADKEILSWSVRFVRELGGKPLLVPEEDKPLYHAAACMASNYLVALMYIVEEIYAAFGLNSSEALEAFWPLVKGTIRNIESSGTVQSLTGPISRGDIGTVVKHIGTFQKRMPSVLEVYRILGKFTAEIGIAKGTLSPEKAETLKKLLQGGS